MDGCAENSSPVPSDAMAYYEQIIASLTSGVIAVDRDGKVITVNAAACAHLGIPASQLHPGVQFDTLEGVQQFADVIREMRETPHAVSRREIALETSGMPKIIGMTASRLKGPELFNGVAFLFIDLSEVRKLERAAELNRQLAQIGELTAGVVHELRNPLSVISGMAELLVRQLSGEEALARRAQAIVEESARLEKLISQFLSFAKPFEIEKRRCAPEELLDRAVQLCARLAREKNVTLDMRCDSELAYLDADRTKVPQALANVIRNAVEAVSAGGLVTVYGAADRGEVVFRVEDNGPGIHLQEGDNLFSPFFSKKEEGTGLGLSIVHRIISAHGGKVLYGNRTAGGAWFELRLPAAENDTDL